MRRWHDDLGKAGVTVSVLTAHADEADLEKGKSALRHHGYPAAALVRVNSHKDRVEGKADATILVDGDQWPDWPAERRLAILDHELTHLELVMKDGAVQRDDCGRPRLRLRKHDFELGGFEAVAERHKRAEIQVEALAKLSRWGHQRGLFGDW